MAEFVRETVQALLKSRGWKEAEAAKAWGVPPGTLNGILRGRFSASLRTLSAICEAEGWTPLDFFAHHPSASQHASASGQAARRLAGAIEGLDPEVAMQLWRATALLARLGLGSQAAAILREVVDLMERVRGSDR